MKPTRILALTLSLTVTFIAAGFAEESEAQRRPNVVVLLVDDLGWKDIGCYDGPVKTPTLDRLAAEGVRFTNFYSGAAVCGPSRAVLLTGRHHARTGIYGNVIFDSIQKPHLLERELTLPEVLRKHGYATAHFGKWHLGMPTRDVKKPTPAAHGFDYWFGMNSGAHPSHKNPVNFLRNGKPVGRIEGYSCQIVVDETISWLDDRRDPEAPFFLNLWFHEPHDRVAAPETIVSQYGDTNDQAAVYSATIDNTDRAIARLLDKLKEVDSLENTLVFYASDNGSYRDDRNGNLRGKKASTFEGGIRVPGIFYWPGTIKKGHVEHEPAGVVDLLPTVCGLLGIVKPVGVHLDGSDISPLLTGRNDEFARHQPLYWHLPSTNPSLAIRDGNYSMVAYRDYEFPRDRAAITQVEKEIEEVLRKANSPELVPWVERTDYFYKVFKNKDAERLRSEFMRLNVFQESWIPVLKSGSYHRFQLFDLGADPSQKMDVSDQHPKIVTRLKRQLLEINASVMAEAPDWGSLAGATTSPRRTRDTSKAQTSANPELLAQIDAMGLPQEYTPGNAHQDYVDRRMAKLNPKQRARIGRLWAEKQRLDPNMPNRGIAFVKIMEFVSAGEKTRPTSRHPASASAAKGKPDAKDQARAIEGQNVLFLAVDDLNDWVGCLGGHPQAKTPNIDRLAGNGVLFELAYCAAPLCSPSRTAIMTGLRPSTTGIYGNLAWFRDIPKYKDWVTIPQYFRKHGYTAVTGGKIYHQPHGKFSDPIAWDKQYSTRMGTPFPPEANRYRHGMRDLFRNKILGRLIDWGPIEQPTEQTDDWKTADKAARFLQKEHDKPFFLACGIYHPHLPWYVPRKYLDMYPLESIELPARKENDLDDIPPVGRRMAGEALDIIKEHGQWKQAVQGRLASGSFADDCVGHVLNALEKSRYHDNTIVVLWGDHGYDIGQKKFAKSALWEQTARTPAIIHAPGMSESGGRCTRPVGLVDLHPTLIELCGLPERDDLDGRSLAPLVRDPQAQWPYPAIITHSPHWHGTNHAIRSERYHYIRYSDGGEELYDMSNDPNQWDNLAGDPEYAETKARLQRWLPKVNAEHFRPDTPENK